MTRGSESTEYVSLVRWDPGQQLQRLSPEDVEYSRGFLRCAPQQWFRGLGAQWLPLSHSLVVELRMQETKCLLAVPHDVAPRIAFEGKMDEESVVLLLENRAAEVILNAAAPDGVDAAHSVILEYLARRILTSLALSWTSGESSIFRFHGLIDSATAQGAGAVKLSMQLNNEVCTLWFLIGPSMVRRMDGLWRRQLLSRSRPSEGEGDYILELAQLGVPPAQVAQYVRTGAVIDLETPLTDRAVLRRKEGAIAVRLAGVGDQLALEFQPGANPAPAVGAGMTRVSISFGKVRLDAASLTELQQPGAVWNTGLALSDNLQMIINGERVANVVLGIYQGRFAVQVK